MSEEVKKAAPLVLNAIKKSNKILLHCHPSPDPDSIGSVLAMAHVLKKMGKDVICIIGDSEIPKNLTALPHYDWIQPKNYTQINPNEFDLFIILDSSAPNQITKLTEVKFPESMTTVVIDHHSTNLKFGKVNLVDSTYPAVCQILYDLFTAWEIKIDADTAVCLFLGMYTDTGGFKYPATTSDTLQVASELAKINPNFPKVIFEMENAHEPQQIEFLGLALTSLEKYFSDNVVISAVPYKELEIRGILKRHTEKMEISNTIKSVVGWNIGIGLVETEPNKVSVSFRTRNADKYDVSKIATAVGVGGGHKAAAGTTIYEPFDSAKKSLLNAIAKVFPELGQP